MLVAIASLQPVHMAYRYERPVGWFQPCDALRGSGFGCKAPADRPVGASRLTFCDDLRACERHLGARAPAAPHNPTGAHPQSSSTRPLVEQDLLTKSEDPERKGRTRYALTERAITLVPVLVHLGHWGERWLPADPALRRLNRRLFTGGPALWETIMQDLRA